MTHLRQKIGFGSVGRLGSFLGKSRVDLRHRSLVVPAVRPALWLQMREPASLDIHQQDQAANAIVGGCYSVEDDVRAFWVTVATGLAAAVVLPVLVPPAIRIFNRSCMATLNKSSISCDRAPFIISSVMSIDR